MSVYRERRPVAERLWGRINVGTPEECWEWNGSKVTGGYGHLRHERRPMLAHRLVWKLTHGEIPEGLWVLHRCDNPPCCNPSHLFLGTRTDNMRDMAAKGRGVYGRNKGDLNGSRTHPERLRRGMAHHFTRFDSVWELLIKELYGSGQYSYSQLSRLFDVSMTMVWQIVHDRPNRHRKKTARTA